MVFCQEVYEYMPPAINAIAPGIVWNGENKRTNALSINPISHGSTSPLSQPSPDTSFPDFTKAVSNGSVQTYKFMRKKR